MARFENCKIEQYVENMTVERMVVGKMRVERQEVFDRNTEGQQSSRNTEIQNPRNTEGYAEDGLRQNLDMSEMPKGHFSWFNQNWDLARKQREVVDIRKDLIEECGKYEKVEKKKRKIMGDVLRERYLRHAINDMPSYAVMVDLFGDLPCLMNERNYAQLVKLVKTGYCDVYKG